MSQQDTNGQLFIWGDDGLESLEDNAVVETPKVLPTQIATLEAFLEEETIQRERPKRTPRRQRHTFSTDEEFCNALENYRNQDIQESLRSNNPLIRMFAILDRRVGKRTLGKLETELDKQPKWLKQLYLLRFEAELN